MSARAMCEAAYGGVSEEEIKKRWPLHWLVWNDEHRSLDRLLGEKEVAICLEGHMTQPNFRLGGLP